MATETVLLHTDSDEVRMRNEIREQIVAKLSNKKYRDTFVSEQINTGLAFQLRALREQKGWTQAELGQRAGMAQSRVSVMEDANYARFSLSTLKRLASAFDVALVVRFEPFSKLLDYFARLDADALNITSFENDVFHPEVPATFALGFANYAYSVYSGPAVASTIYPSQATDYLDFDIRPYMIPALPEVILPRGAD